MPKKVGTTQWKRKRRQEHLEMKKYRYYIFCEGEQTEPQYFTGFKRMIEDNPIYRDMVLIEIEPCAAETMRVIGMAEKYVMRNKLQKGQIWCVYDKDSFPASDFNSVVSRAEQLNKENPELQYHAAWSNECYVSNLFLIISVKPSNRLAEVLSSSPSSSAILMNFILL